MTAFTYSTVSAGLSSNIWFLIAAALKALDVMKQVDGSMLAPSEIFNQAHDFTVFGAGDHHESRNLGLAECLGCRLPTGLVRKPVHSVVHRERGVW